MVYPKVADGGKGIQLWMVGENKLNKQSWTADKRWFSSLGMGVWPITPHCEI
jgi:hypothetical protein